ncbi:2Fe-2S iron-sulfur cluster-binding protein [Enterovirga aerilata]|nr:2Fe-2S iron-sulfur cluster-binding protein [Enterovirga sp. DB1703]
MGMHEGPRRQFYPNLMAMPDVAGEQRKTLEREAHARMTSGLPLLVRGADEATRSYSERDLLGMNGAASTIRQGLSLFESGATAHRALAAGAAPRTVALDWYKSETGLPLAQATSAGSTFFGPSASHLTLMVGLALAAATLLAIQYLRTRRVQALFSRAGQASPPASIARTATSAGPLPVSLPAPPQLPRDTVVPPREAAPRRAWTGALKVAQVVRETPSIKTFRLVEPSGAWLPFDYLPGQFMNVEVQGVGEKPLRRAYTIASSPTRRACAELTVKREAQGKVSQFLHDAVKVGDLLNVSAPYGAFTFTGLEDSGLVLLGGGVGITPLMSVLRYLTDRSWPGEIHFLYSARSTDEFPFRDELAYLQRRHPNLHVLATMTRSEGTAWMGPEGQLTKELIAATVPDIASRRIHVCGPPAMMSAMKDALRALGVPDRQVHTEAFGPASLPVGTLPPAPPTPVESARLGAAAPARAPAAEAVVAPGAITFARSGKATSLAADETVLDAAERAGVDIPWSCRVGVCGTCKVPLRQGSVSMEVEDGLSPEDKAAGYILACQAKAAAGNLIVDA